MTEGLNGVGVKLKALNPFMVHVHCCAHRAALAANDASKHIEKICDYKRTINNVFQYFDNSAARYEQLRELNRVLNNEDLVSLKKPCSVRWMSLHKAVKGIFANWSALCLQLEEDATRGNHGNAVAKGLNKSVKSYSFVALT